MTDAKSPIEQLDLELRNAVGAELRGSIALISIAKSLILISEHLKKSKP